MTAWGRMLLLLLLLGQMDWQASAGEVPRQAAPNFVVVIADDLGATDLGTYGHPVVKTPHIDQLAREGLQFNQAFLTTSSCTASRASILTGRYPADSGAPRLHDAVPAERTLASTHFRALGYYTAAIGKWHLGAPTLQQFDRVIERAEDETGSADWIAALRERPQDKPFFFWLASRDPHVPYDPLPANGLYQPRDAVILPAFADLPGARMNVAQYYTEISHLDKMVGEVRAELAKQGVLDNTVIVFLSDNGAPMPRGKTTLYDSGIRTPLLLRGPGIAAGKKSEALVSSIDLMPTLLALAGLSPVPGMQGQSFMPLLTDPARTHRDAVFAQQFDHGFPIHKQAVRTAQHLLIRNLGENKVHCLLEVQPMGKELAAAHRQGQLNEQQSYCFRKSVPPLELYDLIQDPQQWHNLATDPAHAAERDSLRAALDRQFSPAQ